MTNGDGKNRTAEMLFQENQELRERLSCPHKRAEIAGGDEFRTAMLEMFAEHMHAPGSCREVVEAKANLKTNTDSLDKLKKVVLAMAVLLASLVGVDKILDLLL
jgi:hypothetical protein